LDGELIETTVGRILLKEILPEEIPFRLINKVMKKSELANLIDYCYRYGGDKKTVLLSDRLKGLGYYYATLAGISISLDDMLIPSNKGKLLQEAQQEIERVQEQYTEGLITDGERYNKVIDIWAQVTENIAGVMLKELGSEEVMAPSGEKQITDLYHGRLRSSGECATGASISWDAGLDGQTFWRDHRNSYHRQLS
jgi:DNA-directed RNA polymerase subunit beta'